MAFINLSNTSSFNQMIQLKHISKKFFHQINIGNIICSIFITDSKDLLYFNSKYKSKKYSTDILSFYTSIENSIIKELLGELIISFNYVKIYAIKLNHKRIEEFMILIIHGVCHLIGLNHELSIRHNFIQTLWEKSLLRCIKFKKKEYLYNCSF